MDTNEEVSLKHNHGFPETLSNRQLIVLELVKSLMQHPLHADSPIEELVDCAITGELYMRQKMSVITNYSD